MLSDQLTTIYNSLYLYSKHCQAESNFLTHSFFHSRCTTPFIENDLKKICVEWICVYETKVKPDILHTQLNFLHLICGNPPFPHYEGYQVNLNLQKEVAFFVLPFLNGFVLGSCSTRVLVGSICDAHFNCLLFHYLEVDFNVSRLRTAILLYIRCSSFSIKECTVCL